MSFFKDALGWFEHNPDLCDEKQELIKAVAKSGSQLMQDIANGSPDLADHLKTQLLSVLAQSAGAIAMRSLK